MTETSTTRTGVFLTQFPGAAIAGRDGNPVDWSDHEAAHQAVMRLFSRGLHGPEGRKREAAGILYRVDVAVNGDGEPEPTILVQSLMAPEVVPPVARSIEISWTAWNVDVGDRIVCRVAVNPVRRKSRYYSDAAKTDSIARTPRHEDGSKPSTHRKQIASVVPADDVPQWLAAKFDGALKDIEIISHQRDETATRRNGRTHRNVVDTIDAVATVVDPLALDVLRKTGVGRAKSYGCGLLSIKRMS